MGHAFNHWVSKCEDGAQVSRKAQAGTLALVGGVSHPPLRVVWAVGAGRSCPLLAALTWQKSLGEQPGTN